MVIMILENLKPRAVICDEKTKAIAETFHFEGEIYLYDEMIQTPINAEKLQEIHIVSRRHLLVVATISLV